MAAEGTAVFGEAVALVADALGIELDEIVCEAEYARTTEDVVMDSWTIAAGCVAGVRAPTSGTFATHDMWTTASSPSGVPVCAPSPHSRIPPGIGRLAT